MPEITGIDRELIESTMRKAHIPGVSIAYRDGKTTTPSTTNIGTTDTRDTSIVSDVQDDTVFGAASLSKPVFAYLVLKLIDKGVLSRPGESAASGLDRPLQEVFPLEEFFHEHGKRLSEVDIERAKAITPRMLLSHTSGLGIDASAALSFTPGTEYAYSGTGLEYLQRVIKEQTKKSLGALAQEHVFGELDMKKSSFVPPGASEDKADAANSLYTTASDYAELMTAWMQDPSPIMQQAFVRQISLTQDNQRLPGESNPAAEHVDMKVKERLAWGLGLGLELDETGKAVKAFHTGDMNQFRAQMALDLEKKSCIVYFANAHNDLEANGHVLGPLIITPKIPVDYAHTWFYSKFPFVLNVDQLPEESHFGLRVQGKDKKADSDAVMVSFMPKGVPAPSPHEKREGADASLDVQADSSYAVMRALMPTHSPATVPSSSEIKKQSTEESSRTTVVEEESLAETDKPSSPSPFKMTPKPPDFP